MINVRQFEIVLWSVKLPVNVKLVWISLKDWSHDYLWNKWPPLTQWRMYFCLWVLSSQTTLVCWTIMQNGRNPEFCFVILGLDVSLSEAEHIQCVSYTCRLFQNGSTPREIWRSARAERKKGRQSPSWDLYSRWAVQVRIWLCRDNINSREYGYVEII